MSRRRNIIYILLAMTALLGSCFEEDKPVPAHVPGDEQSFEFEKSIYYNQSFFDLGTNSIVSENGNSAWVLRFAARTGDWHVGINSADYWGVYHTGTSDPDSIPLNPELSKWIEDNIPEAKFKIEYSDPSVEKAIRIHEEFKEEHKND